MRAILAALILCALSVLPAQAGHRHHVHHLAQGELRQGQNFQAFGAKSWAWSEAGSGLVSISTAAGIRITVAADLASRFEGVVADFVAAGYRPRHIGCFARGGHVRHSRHYAGAACDFDQRGWGKTAHFMYTARAHQIIVAHGFRDGREFGDQGHVDDGGTRYAKRSYGSRHGG